MIFSVISIAPGLSPAARRQAVELGPPYVEAETTYPAMLDAAGWRITDQIDLTAAYLATAKRLLIEDQAHEDGLRDLLGEADSADRLNKDRELIDAIADGLYRRELFSAVPMTHI